MIYSIKFTIIERKLFLLKYPEAKYLGNPVLQKREINECNGFNGFGLVHFFDILASHTIRVIVNFRPAFTIKVFVRVRVWLKESIPRFSDFDIVDEFLRFGIK